MSEMEVVKQESLQQQLEARCICEACLVSGRRLVRVPAAVSNDFANFKSVRDGSSDVSVCWECTAVLKKLLRFRLRAARAQEWIEWAYNQPHAELVLPNASASSLLCVTKSTFDAELDHDEPQIEVKIDVRPTDDYACKDDVSKVECESDEFAYDGSEDLEKELVVKLEPPDGETFSELLPDEPRKRKKKRIKERRVKVKREVKKEEPELLERKKRPKANPFDNYTVTQVSNEEVLRRRGEERANPWYVKSPHKCESCIYGFRSEAQFNKHILTNHSPEAGNYVCWVCETRTQTKILLDKHLKIHHERYVCNACGESFSRIHNMRQHFTAKHKSRKCKYCTEEFYDLKSLRQHRRAMHLSFQCDKCGKKTTSRYTLKKHLRTHEPYPCGSCDMIFTKKKNLDQHVRNRHETRASEAYCVECDRQFASRPSYLLHVTEKHSPAVRFRCPACDKPFNRKVYMKNHYNLMHLKKTNYYCKLCDKYICRKDGLRKHIEFVHEGKRLPKNKMCDICGRGFSTNKTLVHHRRTHTGERPHQCEYCAAAFAQITALKTHVKHIHLPGERRAKAQV